MYEDQQLDNQPVPDLPLLRKAVDWVTEQAARPEVDSEWYQDNWREDGQDLGRDCGTAHCLAGYITDVVLGLQPDGSAFVTLPDGRLNTVGGAATDALRITENEADDLFAGGNGLDDIRAAAESIAERAGEEL